MNSLATHSFFIFFLLKGIATTPTSKYDITNVLNNTIVRTLQSIDWNKRLASTEDVISSNANHIFVTENIPKLQPVEDKISILINRISGSSFTKVPGNIIFWEFSENKVHFAFKALSIHIFGEVQSKQIAPYWGFPYTRFKAPFLKCYNLTITATKSSTCQNNDTKIEIDASCGYLTHGWGIILEDRKSDMSYKQILKLVYAIGTVLPLIIRDRFTNNVKFTNLLSEMFIPHPKHAISSIYPDFLNNENQYYYLIPEIPFVHVNMKNIQFKGLWNFEPYQCNTTIVNCNHSRYTLPIENIRGNMILDPGFENLPCIELNFTIDTLVISIDDNSSHIRSVDARDYFIIEKTPKRPPLISSWLSKYASVLMKTIESAVAKSLMPSTTDNSESFSSSIREMETSLIQVLKKFVSKFSTNFSTTYNQKARTSKCPEKN